MEGKLGKGRAAASLVHLVVIRDAEVRRNTRPALTPTDKTMVGINGEADFMRGANLRS